MPNGVNVSRDLRWLLTKNSSCHAVKVRNYPKAFSKDPLNPKGIHLPRFSGSIQTQAVTVHGSAKKKGVTLVYKRKDTVRKPANQLVRVSIKRDPRSTMRSIKNILSNTKARRDLKMLTLRRASAIMKSQVDKSKKKGNKKQKKAAPKK